MLDLMRQNANKWFIKFLLILVMASFVLWGVVDMVMRSQSNKSVANVGGHAISAEALVHGIDRLMQSLQQRGAKGVDVSLVVDRALKDLINAQLVDQELDQLGLAISDNWLRDVVHNLPVFQRQGRFDPELFRSLLAQNHLSDVRFLSDLRDQLKTQHYTGAVLSGVSLPKPYRQYVAQAIQTPYVFASVSLTTKQMPEPKAPTAEDLNLYYSNNTNRYIQGEQRVIHILHIDTSKLVENTVVEDAAVQALYDERASSWQSTERRDVQRLTFSTRAAAEKAVKQMTEGKILKKLSKEWPQATYQEESFEKSQAPEALANILFTLKEGDNTGIIETPSGYSVYQVVKIHPAATQQLDATLRKQLEQEIRMSRSGDAMKQWLDQLNDSLASGQSVADLAKKFGLKVTTAKILESGKTMEGTWPAGLKPDVCQKIAKEAFVLSLGQASPFLEIDDHSSVVVSLESVTSARTPEFKEIEGAVKRDWVNNAKEKMIEDKCRNLIKSTNVQELSKAAAASGLSVTMHKPISSLQLQEALMADPKNKDKVHVPSIFLELDGHTVINLFSLQSGESVVGRTGENGWAVVMFDTCLKPTASNDKTFEAGLNAAFERDASALLLLALHKKHSVTVDTEMVKQVSERMQQSR